MQTIMGMEEKEEKHDSRQVTVFQTCSSSRVERINRHPWGYTGDKLTERMNEKGGFVGQSSSVKIIGHCEELQAPGTPTFAAYPISSAGDCLVLQQLQAELEKERLEGEIEAKARLANQCEIEFCITSGDLIHYFYLMVTKFLRDDGKIPQDWTWRRVADDLRLKNAKEPLSDEAKKARDMQRKVSAC